MAFRLCVRMILSRLRPNTSTVFIDILHECSLCMQSNVCIRVLFILILVFNPLHNKNDGRTHSFSQRKHFSKSSLWLNRKSNRKINLMCSTFCVRSSLNGRKLKIKSFILTMFYTFTIYIFS